MAEITKKSIINALEAYDNAAKEYKTATAHVSVAENKAREQLKPLSPNIIKLLDKLTSNLKIAEKDRPSNKWEFNDNELVFKLRIDGTDTKQAKSISEALLATAPGLGGHSTPPGMENNVEPIKNEAGKTVGHSIVMPMLYPKFLNRLAYCLTNHVSWQDPKNPDSGWSFRAARDKVEQELWKGIAEDKHQNR